MDLKVYYAKIREAAAKIPGQFTVLVSRETPDGGKPDVMSEAPRDVAARMLVEGRARLATVDETNEFYRQQRELRAKAELQAVQSRLQLAVISEKQLEALKPGTADKTSEEK
jgi:hypothetical protein